MPIAPSLVGAPSFAQTRRAAPLAALGALLAACATGSPPLVGAGGATTTDAIPPDEALNFDTAEFSVPAGKETYMCYTMKLDADLAVDRFTYEAQPGVHHLLLVQTLAPESDAPFECDVLFKQTWLPVFATGTGSADVRTPEGSAFKVPKGSQLLVQLHLLNAGNTTLKGKTRLTMHENRASGLMAAGLYAFGTQKVDLPPQAKSSLQSDCTPSKDLQVFAVFPHMHKLGQSLSFWSGKDAASLTKRFSVDSWTFGEQQIYPLQLTLPSGTMTRVTCDYDNSTPDQVTFGESTSNEMCYFVAFVAPYDGPDGCITTQ